MWIISWALAIRIQACVCINVDSLHWNWIELHFNSGDFHLNAFELKENELKSFSFRRIELKLNWNHFHLEELHWNWIEIISEKKNLNRIEMMVLELHSNSAISLHRLDSDCFTESTPHSILPAVHFHYVSEVTFSRKFCLGLVHWSWSHDHNHIQSPKCQCSGSLSLRLTHN